MTAPRRVEIVLEGNDIVGIARTCYEACRAFQTHFGGMKGVPWELAGVRNQWEAERRVREIGAGVASDPAAVHTRWVDRLRKEGWRFGLIADRGAQTHPLLVDFDALTIREQTQYGLFFNTAQMLLAGLAYWRSRE